MVDLKKIADSRTAVMWISPSRIKVMPSLNARDMDSAETREHVAGIAASIEAQGFLQSHPLEIFTEGEDIYVAAGHCRLAAVNALIAKGIEIVSIPCMPEARGTSAAQRQLNQITSNTGQRLNLAEEGKIYARLIAMGYVIGRIAKDAGRSEAHIRQALDFNAAPQEAHQLVSEGKVSATLAAKVTREEGGAEGVRKLKAAVEKAESEGKTKAKPRHIEPRQTSPREPKFQPARSSEGAQRQIINRIAKMEDPRDMDAIMCQRELIRIWDSVRDVYAAPVHEAAE